jgi:hypothetical protein
MGGNAVDLKGLIHRELGEGLTETELATAVGVSLRTIEGILSDKPPQGSYHLGEIRDALSDGCGFPANRRVKTYLNPSHTIRRRPVLPYHRNAESPLAHLASA